jgi:hypothetical protein
MNDLKEILYMRGAKGHFTWPVPFFATAMAGRGAEQQKWGFNNARTQG